MLALGALFFLLVSAGTARAALSGTYTIGTSGSENYSSIDAAISALSSNGVSGPVVFRISSGSYTSYGYWLYSVAGMSSTNTVTFQPAVGATVSITGSVTYQGIFTFSGSSYFIIDGNSSSGASVTRGLTITQTYGSSYSAAIFFMNGASYNTVRNAKLISNNYFYLSSSSGGSVVQISSYYGGNGNSYNVIDNNVIGDPTGTYRSPAGVYIYGNSSYPNRGNRITNNRIINFGQGNTSSYSYSGYGIDIYYSPETIIRGNEITMTTEAPNYYNYGIYFYDYYGYSRNSRIDGNNIHDIQGYQPYGYEYHYAIYAYVYDQIDDSLVICNNMLSSTRSNQYYYGLYLSSPYYASNSSINIVNNSFYYSGNYSYYLLEFQVYATPPVFNIQNNVFKLASGTNGYLHYFYFDPSYTPTFYVDHNLYDVPSTGVNGYYGYSYYSTLSSWNTGAGLNQNSITGDPRFLDAANGNLHIDTVAVSLLEGRAVPFSYVPTDIDGNTRSATFPDIGADEGNFNGGGITVAYPNGGEQITAGFPLPVTIVLNRDLPVRIELSLDGGSTWSSMGNFSNAAGRVVDTIVAPNLETNRALVRVISQLNSHEADTSDRVFSLVRPIVTLLAPNGGERLVPTDTAAVRWTSQFVPSSVSVRLDYSTDGGLTWITSASGLSSTNLPGTNTFAWQVPNAPTQKALVRAMLVGVPVGDTSNALFTILPQPAVTVLAPNGGEGIYAGSTYPIRWSSISTDNVRIEYTLDDGTSWTNALQGGIRSVPAYLGEYPWQVPDVETNQARIRVTNDERLRFTDQSDGDFTILKSDLAVLTPITGASYALAQPVTVTWAARNVTSLKVEYSWNNGTSWLTVNPAVDATSTSTLVFTPPAIPTRTAIVRITSNDRPGLTSSTGLFEITESPSIMIFSPVAGDKLIAGSTHQISFETHGISSVDIAYSSNGGVSWSSIATGIQSWRGIFDWNVPTITTSKGLIRITQSGGSVSATSGQFSIINAPRPALHVLVPNGGESYTEGDQIMIRWTYADVSLVTVSYSSDDGATWNTIQANVAANLGALQWTVPSSPGTKYLVRVSGVGASDQSDATFTVLRKLHPAITVVYPNGGETLTEGDTVAVQWSATDIPGNVDVSFSSDAGSNWQLIRTVPSTPGQLSWIVPTMVSNNVVIRVSDPVSSVFDVSDAPFAVQARLVPALQVITPNTATETWSEGSTATVTWAAQKVSQINIKVSIDGGTTFRDLAQAVDATLGTWSWSVDHMSNDTLHSLVVRIVDASNPSLFDDSDQPFGFIPRKVSDVATTAVTGRGLALEGAYPNPVSDRMEIRWYQSSSSTAVVRIYAASGRLLGETPLGTLGAGEQRSAIHVDGLSSGVYLYELGTNNGTLRGTFVVAR